MTDTCHFHISEKKQDYPYLMLTAVNAVLKDYCRRNKLPRGLEFNIEKSSAISLETMQREPTYKITLVNKDEN